MERRSPTTWLIAGPTAAGKSALALRLAREAGGEIVNADSMQVYRDLRILTGRPTVEQESETSHHLYGVADAAEPWSVGRWLSEATRIVAEIAARGRLAIVVGGTGLYFNALTRGLAAIPPTPLAVREAAAARLALIGEAAFRDALAEVDPAAAARIALGDRQRLIRAWSVREATGRALSDWQVDTRAALPAGSWRGVVLDPPRPDLGEMSERRLRAMLAAGVLPEVTALLARGLDPGLPAMKALGVAAFAAQLAGRLSPEAASARVAAETRRYAKRQTTWFRNQQPDWPRVTNTEPGEGWRECLAHLRSRAF